MNKEVPVRFTEKALAELKRLRTHLKLSGDQYLRIGMKGGGCGGMNFLLAFDHRTDADNIYHTPEFDVIVNKAHVMYVLGLEIDWEESGNSRGFVFNNPEHTDNGYLSEFLCC